MKKLLYIPGFIAALGFAGAAVAGEPTVMTDSELDKITAGDTSGGGVRARTIVLGAYSLVFDGRRWSIVFN